MLDGLSRICQTHTPHDGNISSFTAMLFYCWWLFYLVIQRFKSLESKLATVKCGLYNNSNNGKQSCYRNENCKIKQYNKLKNLFKLLRSLVCKSHIKDMFIDRIPQTEAQTILQHNFTPPQYVKYRPLKFQSSFNFKIFTQQLL